MSELKKIYLMYPKKKGTVAPEIYGHFAEHIGGVIYDGRWVGKDSDITNIKGFRKEIIDKLKNIKAPGIRWPGGCYAEIYDWRDGIGEERPTRINFWNFYDEKNEPNEVGTHEFMDFCEAVGAKPYFAANMSTTTPLHIRNWMDYCMSPKGSTTLAKEREKNGHPEPFDIPFWGIGNENWGCGGNMNPDYYANEYRKYATTMHYTFRNKHLAKENPMEFYACGEDAFDFNWTDGVMRNLKDSLKLVNGFCMHYYCNIFESPYDYTDKQWDEMMEKASKMEDIIKRNWNIICAYGMEEQAKLIVDEWGCWYPGGYGPSKGANLFEQQSTIRDAVVTALTLNIFNNNCDKVRMANVAQVANCIHSLFLASEDKCITTPIYHVFDMYKEHQGADAIETFVTDNTERASSVSVSASVKNGKTLVTVANLSCKEDFEISLEAIGTEKEQNAKATLLSSDNLLKCNTFEEPDAVVPRSFEVDISKHFTIPKASVLSVEF